MEELEESELGTLEYWNNAYNKELNNFRSHGDVGEIWFGEDIVDRIIRWLEKSALDKNIKVLDVGCGNGMLLVEMWNEGYRNTHGVDYSKEGILLAKNVAKKAGCNTIRYDVIDIVVLHKNMLGQYNIIFDKGTYDAISLSKNPQHNRNMYIDNISKYLLSDGLFVITSCNWTKDELITQFEREFQWAEDIPTTQFKFGGKIGNVVSSVVFKKQ